jgi:hypothetical protein
MNEPRILSSRNTHPFTTTALEPHEQGSPALADEIYVCESQSPVSYNALNLWRPSVASHPGPLASDRSVPAGGAATATLSLTAANSLRGNGTAAGGGGGAAEAKAQSRTNFPSPNC